MGTEGHYLQVDRMHCVLALTGLPSTSIAAYLGCEDARCRSGIFGAQGCGYLVIVTPLWTALKRAVEEARKLSGAIRLW